MFIDDESDEEAVSSKLSENDEKHRESPIDSDELSPDESLNNMDESFRNISKINLDVTTLIALVSEITNGGQDFAFKQAFLNKQAEWERTKRLIPELEEFMSGKELLVCETAYNDFLNIVNTVGGPNEKDRTKKLMERIKVVADSPSARAINLKDSSKIKPRAKIIFGTGDSLQAITMTSNIGFVRAAIQQNVLFTVYFHGSPPLTLKRMLSKDI